MNEASTFAPDDNDSMPPHLVSHNGDLDRDLKLVTLSIDRGT
jgi:hypothetical protein